MSLYAGHTTPIAAELERQTARIQATCEHKRTTVTDRTIDRLMGNVVCADCGKFIRTFDAG